ncbi:MAG: hypothetical protein NVS3B26_18920 [Mycobacteriales bacterium]
MTAKELVAKPRLGSKRIAQTLVRHPEPRGELAWGHRSVHDALLLRGDVIHGMYLRGAESRA